MHAFDRQTDRRTDRQTDRQTEISSLDRVCIACSAVIIMAGCIAHAHNGRIFTSGEKSDVSIVFLDLDFLQYAKISAICVHLRQIIIGLLNICVCFQDLGLKWGFCGQNRGRGGVILTP